MDDFMKQIRRRHMQHMFFDALTYLIITAAILLPAGSLFFVLNEAVNCK